MPVCRYNPEQNNCENDDNLYWNDLDEQSKQLCKQEHPNCGPLINYNPQPQIQVNAMNINDHPGQQGQGRRRRRASRKSKKSRKQNSRKSKKDSRKH